MNKTITLLNGQYYDPFKALVYGKDNGIDDIPDEEVRLSSYSRIPFVLNRHMMGEFTTDEAVEKLGKFWTMSDNISIYRDEILDLFDACSDVHALFMSDEDKEKFDALPEEFTVYRGCDSLRNANGISYTLSRKIAERFPFLMRYHAPNPSVVVATVSKFECFGYKGGRGEKEIVVSPVCIERIIPIKKPE